jgi:hypothetical protein
LINGDDMTTEDGERIAARPGCHLDDALVLDRLQNACHEKIVSRRMLDSGYWLVDGGK